MSSPKYFYARLIFMMMAMGAAAQRQWNMVIMCIALAGIVTTIEFFLNYRPPIKRQKHDSVHP